MERDEREERLNEGGKSVVLYVSSPGRREFHFRIAVHLVTLRGKPGQSKLEKG